MQLNTRFNVKQLARKVAQRSKLPQGEVYKLLNHAIDIIREELYDGKEVVLHRLLVLYLQEIPPTLYMLPNGEKVFKGLHYTPKARYSKHFKKYLKEKGDPDDLDGRVGRAIRKSNRIPD